MRKIKSIGNVNYFLKECEINKKVIPELIDLRCSFEKYQKGLLMRISKGDLRKYLMIPYSEIERFELIKGKETINTEKYTPLWILLKTGVRLKYARYFAIGKINEHRIEELNLNLKMKDLKLNLIINGYSYESQNKLFKDIR